MSAELKSHRQGRTLVLTICHPAQDNALSPALCAAAVEALGVAETNAETRSIVITGEGAVFSAGPPGGPALASAQALDSLQSVIDAIRTFPKPVLAAVNGPARGAGLTLALACDFIIAETESVFAADGVLMVGPAHVLQFHKELLLHDTPVGADRLHAIGLVSRLAQPTQSLTQACEFAAHLELLQPARFVALKESLEESANATWSRQFAQQRATIGAG